RVDSDTGTLDRGGPRRPRHHDVPRDGRIDRRPGCGPNAADRRDAVFANARSHIEGCMSAVEIIVNGRATTAERGTTAAAALFNAGGTAFRTSVTGESRAPLCGMGICFECRVTIDGIAHQRACLAEVAQGM